MATTTPNIGLTLPAGAEGWKRSVINGNFTILDTKIGAVGNTPLQDQITALSSQKASYEEGTWTPHLYDYTTKLRELTDGRYIKIGGLTFAYYYSNNPNLSGISTMLQIKNLPMATVLAGGIYIGALTDGNGGKITVQFADGSIYFRPNIVSSQMSNATSPGYVNFWAIGI